MSLDSSLVKSLNEWGQNHQSLVHAISNDFVYLTILLAGSWLLASTWGGRRLGAALKDLVVALVRRGVLILGIPVAIATILSELISKIYARDRPFVTVPGVKLLVPHSPDGGMPSHHMVFMAAIVVSIYFYNKQLALFLGCLTLLSGVGRIMAGIHYPTDIIAGLALGSAVAYLYQRVFAKNSKQGRRRTET